MCELPPTLEPVIDLTNSQGGSQQTGESAPVWGKLLPLTKGFGNVDLRDQSYSFGRASVAEVDVSFDNDQMKTNKNFPAYSKVHFKLHRELSSGDAHTVIEDLSSNGTFVNGHQIGKNNRRVLVSNDEIGLATKTGRAFIYLETGLGECAETFPPELREKYVVTREIGRGAMGEVRLAFTKGNSCDRVAIKIISKSKLQSPGGVNFTQLIEREIGILRCIKHPCVVEVVDVFDSEEKTFIVMELIEGGELFKRITSSDKGRLAEAVAKILFYQMLQAVKYLHEVGITHRDLKPENILLANDLDETLVKVTDFGLSKLVEGSSILKTMCGTPSYLAPEILRSADETGMYTQAVDMWSLGVILFIMLSGYMPFSPDYKDMPLRDQILTGRYKKFPSHWKDVSDTAFNLVKLLLTVDPNQRPTASAALEDPWFQDDETKRKAHEIMYPPPGSTLSKGESTKKRSADDENGSENGMDTTQGSKKSRAGID